MMDFLDPQVSIPVGLVVAVSGLVLTWQKIVKNAKRDREEHAARILQAAKEEDSLLKAKLEARIEKFGAELKNLEFNINKDISHVRESYNTELKNLGEKIENLRTELSNQHSSLLALLTKLVDKNKK
jgi:hypothetical protein